MRSRHEVQTNPSGPWLNADQATEYLGLPSRKALYQRVRRGQIPAHRLGRNLRFSQAELDDAIKDEGQTLQATVVSLLKRPSAGERR